MPDPCNQLMDLGSWLCGSSVDYVEGLTLVKPNDYDIMIPPDQYQNACRLVRVSGLPHCINRKGGIKISLLNGSSLDIWPGTIESFLTELTIPVKSIRLLRLRPFTRLVMGTNRSLSW